MWTALFEALNTGFQLVRDLVRGRTSPVDAAVAIADAKAAREGTAAGAAAHDAAAHPKH